MNTKFGDMSLYFGVITAFLAVGSTLHFINYSRLRKRLLQLDQLVVRRTVHLSLYAPEHIGEEQRQCEVADHLYGR